MTPVSRKTFYDVLVPSVSIPGLLLNAVRVFETACSVFESERVRLNMFGLSEHLFGSHVGMKLRVCDLIALI